MKKLWFVLSMLVGAACAQAQPAVQNKSLLPQWVTQAFEADAPERTLYIYGVIDKRIFRSAAQLDHLSKDSSAPVTLVINSPGGSVLPGSQFVSAMRIARTRGVRIRCVVPMVAASMAFIILNECDERYALDNALLLWHDVSVGLLGNYTARDLMHIATDMAVTAADYEQRSITALGIDAETYAEYYEMLIPANQLTAIAPDYLKVVADIKGARYDFFRLDAETQDVLDAYLTGGTGSSRFTVPGGAL